MLEDYTEAKIDAIVEEVKALKEALVQSQMTLMAVQMALRDVARTCDLPSDIILRYTEGIVASIEIQTFLRSVYLASLPKGGKPAYGGAKVFH
jgi:hypothetical protein